MKAQAVIDQPAVERTDRDYRCASRWCSLFARFRQSLRSLQSAASPALAARRQWSCVHRILVAKLSFRVLSFRIGQLVSSAKAMPRLVNSFFVFSRQQLSDQAEVRG